MSTGPSINRHRSNSTVATPWPFIFALESKFGPITYDLAATAKNTKHPIRFITPEQDSLRQVWANHRGQHPYLNPPFDKIAPWAEKADQETRPGQVISFLVPASVGSNWYRDFIWRKHRTIALNARIQFVGSTDPYPKDLMLVRFGEPWDFEVWRWTEEGSGI